MSSDHRPSTKDGRIAGVDGLRFLAAGLIVWIHTAESPEGKSLIPLCRMAVPFFIATFVVFGVRHLERGTSEGTWTHYAWKKFSRLYVPFLIWSALFLVLRLLKHQLFGGGSPITLSPATLLTGTAHHLWFLPFALAVALILPPLCRLTTRYPFVFPWSVFFILIAVGMSWSGVPFPTDAAGNPVSYFAAMSWTALPAALLAVPLAVFLPCPPSKRLVSAAWVGLGIVIIAILQFPNSILLHCLGGVLLWLCGYTHIPHRIRRAAVVLGQSSFGIYLVHVAFVEGLQVTARKTGWSVSLPADLWIALISLVASLAVTTAAWSSPRLRYLLPR